ncbi:MAG: hypothetical protein ABW224_15205 [Kibdelosporangium sp.]
MSAKAWTRTASVALLTAGLVGCGTQERTPLVVPVPQFNSSSPAGSAVAPARIVGALPTGCGAIASAEEISESVGQAMTGAARLVTGTADPNIGRTARVDCYYGLTDGQELPDAPVRVGLASYTDAKAATTRIDKAVSEEREAGSKVSDVQVGPDKGTLLIGKKIATLVATYQATTVVVIAQLSLVPANQAPSMLGKIADRALSPR